jgi:hypothetical protein
MRRLLLPLLAVLATLGGGAFAMDALRSGAQPPGFGMTISPARQTIAPGQRVSFSVTVRRADRRVSLRAVRLPRGVRAGFKLGDGTRSRVVPAGQNGAILTLVASRRADPGRSRIVVRAKSRGRTRRRAVRLTLVSPRDRLVRVMTRPRSRTVLAGETAGYRVYMRRRRRGRVRLGVTGLPEGTRASWSRSPRLRGRRRSVRLRLLVAPDAERGSSRPVIYVRGRLPSRDAVVVLNVEEGREFEISGDLGPLLYPGADEPLELRLTNPNGFTIEVTRLHVAIRPGTSNEGCGSDNYAVAQYSGAYPLRLRPGTTALGKLVGDRAQWPRVRMLNLPTNQDVCKHARLTLDYSGTATR